MLLLLGIILAIAWILAWGVYHVSSAAIHLLLLFAVIALVLQLVRSATTRTPRRV
jgi:hypothetical protein